MNVLKPQTPESEHHETLRSVATLCGSAALLIGIAAVLSGSMSFSSERASLALQSAVNGQAAAVATYNSNGSWTAPAGVFGVLVSVIGGGGGGTNGTWSQGGCSGDAGVGGAGGSGGYISNQVVAVTPGQTYGIVVGAGGGGGAYGCPAYNNGRPGGNSSFSNVTATGGGAGVWYSGGAGGSPGGAAGSGGAWYYCGPTTAGKNGSGYGNGGLSQCNQPGQAGTAGAVFVNNPLSLTANPASVGYNGASALSYAAATISTGTHLYVGLVANCNAGIVTTNPNYMSCATRSIGYTTGASGGTALYALGGTQSGTLSSSGAVRTSSASGATSIGYTTNTAGGAALYVGPVSWCNAGIVSTDSNYLNCGRGLGSGGPQGGGGPTTQFIGYTSNSAGGYDACYLSGGQWTGSGIAVGTSGSTNTNGLTSNTTYSYTCHDISYGWIGPVTTTVTVAIPGATVALTATPLSIYTGQSSTLSWSGTNLASCSLAGGTWGSGTAVAVSSAGISTGALSQSTTYTLTCAGLNGASVGDTKVIAAVPRPTVSISANPTTVGTGARTTATWSSSNVQAGTCTEYVVRAQGQPNAFASSQSGSQQTPPLTQSGWLEIDCQDLTGAWAVATAPFTVSGTNQPPTVSISPNPAYVRLGSASTISWSSQNASSCSVAGPSFSASGVSGSKSTGNLLTVGDYTYTITCPSPFGFPDATGLTDVYAVDLPAIFFAASPSSVLPGGLSTLTWTCPNPPYTSSTGDTHYSTGGAASGSAGVNPLQTTTYSVTCNAAGGLTTGGSAQVTVLQPSLTITATPNKVKKGSTATIVWSATNVTAGSCRVAGTDGSSWSGSSGSQSPIINAPTTFTLACSVPSGPLSQSVTVGLIPNIKEI